MKVEIKNRYNGNIILCGEYESIADCINKNSYANLRHANLSSADISNANLLGEKINKAPMFIYGLKYNILFTEKHIKIGCEVHEANEWKKFDDKRILGMEGNAALRWWKENKTFIMYCHKQHIKNVK